jgi:hypothetical protein
MQSMKKILITGVILCAVMFLALLAWGIDITEEPPEGHDPGEGIKKEEPSGGNAYLLSCQMSF